MYVSRINLPMIPLILEFPILLDSNHITIGRQSTITDMYIYPIPINSRIQLAFIQKFQVVSRVDTQ